MARSPAINHETRKAIENAARVVAQWGTLDEWHALTLRTLDVNPNCPESLSAFLETVTPEEVSRLAAALRLGITFAQSYRLAIDEAACAGSN